MRGQLGHVVASGWLAYGGSVGRLHGGPAARGRGPRSMVDRACGGASARAGCGAAGRGGATRGGVMGAAAELQATAMRGTRRHAEGTGGPTRRDEHDKGLTSAS